ncbi:MAG: hypothetical protein V1895_01615 [Parcubacteria group bacterium]
MSINGILRLGMAGVSSREKALYWVLIVLIALGGGGALAYFYFTGQRARTSLSDVATTGAGPVESQSLVDIVENTDSGPAAGNKVNTVIVANNTANKINTPITANNSQNRTNQLVTAEPQVNRTNQLVSAQPRNAQNDFLAGGTLISGNGTGTVTASGSGVPTEPPETGAEVLILSGLASLGISGVASALVLRGRRRRGTRAT